MPKSPKVKDIFGSPLNSTRTLPEPFEFDTEISFGPEGLEFEGPQTETGPRYNPIWFYLSLISVLGLLIGQSYRLQISNAQENLLQAKGNSVRIQTIQAERGLIKDKNGTILAQNSQRLALAIDPQTLPRKKAERESFYQTLRQKIQLTDAEITEIEERRLYPDPIPLRTNLDKDTSLLYREWFSTTSGITIVEVPVRQYSELGSLSHILGYTGIASEEDTQNGASTNAQVGKTGLELEYNQELSGIPGKQYVETDANGDIVKPIENPNNRTAQVGETLKLNLDLKLQQVVETALKNELERRTKKYGNLPNLGASAVVLNPQTGGVLAMVSLPNYSTNLFTGGIKSADYQALLNDAGDPLLNRAIQGQYASGSTLKPLVAAAGLQEKLITATTQLETPLAIQIGDFRFPDWKYHGSTNTIKAIAESNNIFFYSLGGGWEEKHFAGLGITRLQAYLKSFGLGAKTEIDLPGEASGLVPTPEWKKKTFNEDWYIGNTYQMSIGQGYLQATPLQMATATMAIANGGKLYTPHLLYSTINPENNTETVIPAREIHPLGIEERYLSVVRQGMREAVLTGSARYLNKLQVTSAGKTGTAEFGNKGLTHAWYTGFAPYDNPQIAFAILIEGGGESFYSSVPVAEEILRGCFNEPLAPGQSLYSAPNDASMAAMAAEFAGER